uniref:hypothetical protein n=1 Tax=Candidatus Electrothrix sp. TaxID=2170559 RepID=UPI004057784D
MNRELEYLKKAQGLKNELDNLDNPIPSTPSSKGFAKEVGGFLLVVLVVLGILGAVTAMGVFMVAKDDPTYLTSPLWYPIRALGMLIWGVVAGAGMLMTLAIIGIFLSALGIPLILHFTEGLEEKTISEKFLTVSKRFGKLVIKIALIVAVIAAVLTTIFFILEAESGANYLQGPLLDVLLFLGVLLRIGVGLAVFIGLPVGIISIYTQWRRRR